MCCALTFRVEVLCPPGVKVTDELLSDVLGPDMGETTVERVTVPANPFRLVTVIRLFPDVPHVKLRDDALTVIEKSDTITRTETEWATDPLVPVTVTV